MFLSFQPLFIISWVNKGLFVLLKEFLLLFPSLDGESEEDHFYYPEFESE